MIKRIWQFMNMPCAEVTRLVSAGYDRELTGMERFAIRSHLLYCRACHRFRKQWDSLRRALAEAGSRDDLPAGRALSDAARERIARLLESDPG